MRKCFLYNQSFAAANSNMQHNYWFILSDQCISTLILDILSGYTNCESHCWKGECSHRGILLETQMDAASPSVLIIWRAAQRMYKQLINTHTHYECLCNCQFIPGIHYRLWKANGTIIISTVIHSFTYICWHAIYCSLLFKFTNPTLQNYFKGILLLVQKQQIPDTDFKKYKNAQSK